MQQHELTGAGQTHHNILRNWPFTKYSSGFRNILEYSSIPNAKQRKKAHEQLPYTWIIS
jgi:hypothetical protein